MKQLNGLPLDDDVVDRILMFSPDFVTLKSVILTSKAFHNVFQLYPNSIVRAVAYNIVGPALSQALRYVRYSDSGHETDTGDALDCEETGEYVPIKAHETVDLIRNAKMVKEMEKLFSLRHKDYKSKGTRLTFMESLRFQRAMYRIMLYCRIFDGEKYSEEHDPDNDSEDGDMAERLAEVRRERKKFLGAFSDEQLIQIHSVSRFLVETASTFYFYRTANVLSDTSDNLGDIALSASPDVIYACYETGSSSALVAYIDGWNDDILTNVRPMISGYLSHPLAKLYEERKVKPPSTDTLQWKAILDSVEGENDTCARCEDKVTKGSNLWGPTTYDFLTKVHSNFKSSLIIAYLPGHLRYNRVEGPYCMSLMSKIPPEENAYEYVVQDILDSDYKQDAFEDWKKDDHLCMSCLTKLLRENLHLWLLNKRIQAGDTVLAEDCWWGWNCRTQTHKQTHAEGKNHICPQTRFT
ncbi:hypothetical protein V5O48_010426 [Marasmius crinis-equi]|uniref:F-box domain-containing protein n=1 Tax=Marasmius crinis-equi TaxID=585013 RepID=A0ABR3F8G9_9AGAR